MLQRTNGCGLIFVRTKRSCSHLYKTLSEAGAPIGSLHGDLAQAERDSSLHAFKNGRAKVLVATDVAQRGLDIKNVQCVINYDPPANLEDYVHRIGRTGRAGEKGDAFTCLYESERPVATQIAQVMRKSGQDIPKELASIIQGSVTSAPHLTGQWSGRYAQGGDSGERSYGGGGGYSRRGF